MSLWYVIIILWLVYNPNTDLMATNPYPNTDLMGTNPFAIRGFIVNPTSKSPALTIYEIPKTSQSHHLPYPMESIPYHTGRYGRHYPYLTLKQYQNTCVSFRFKYRLYWVVPAIPDEISHFGRKNHTGPKHDFQFKKKEKFSDPISLSPLSVTY